MISTLLLCSYCTQLFIILRTYEAIFHNIRDSNYTLRNIENLV